MRPSIVHASTALFVPGDRPERFAKAVASNADFVIVDLEDAISASSKETAREAAVAALIDDATAFSAAVRVNAVREGGLVDAAALVSTASRLLAVILPKAEDEDEVGALVEILGPTIPIIALIESVRGLRHISRIAGAPGVVRLAFGALDFAVDADATSSTLLDHARAEIVLQSRAAGLPAPLESPSPDFGDLDALEAYARRARSLGFGGQLCIHPVQVPVVADAFRPSQAEVAWALRIVEAETDGVSQIDGAMVDRPVVLRARATLNRSQAGTSRPASRV